MEGKVIIKRTTNAIKMSNRPFSFCTILFFEEITVLFLANLFVLNFSTIPLKTVLCIVSLSDVSSSFNSAHTKSISLYVP